MDGSGREFAMNWRHYLFLFLLGLLANGVIASFQDLPGYIDADYYFVGGTRLIKGEGFSDPYIWNYIDNPAGLPHPSFTYWNPLASFVAALGMLLARRTTYTAGRLGFILIAACIPPLTGALAHSMTRNNLLSLVSGLLCVFPFFFAPFLPVPDNYGIFMLLGAMFLLLVFRRERWIRFVLGLISGLMTLARSDGMLWLGLAGLSLLWNHENDSPQALLTRIKKAVSPGVLLLLGYLLIMAPWYYRNWITFGALMAPGSAGLLWLQDYSDIFAYPFDRNSFSAFVRAGWQAALGDRLGALQLNSLNFIFLQNGLVLFPFIAIGLWQIRHDYRTRLAVMGWLILFFVMTFVYPFAGLRGSFFHASAAFQTLWWVAAPLGVDALFLGRRERGDFDENYHVIAQGVLVALAVIVTLYLVHDRVIKNGWPRDDQMYSSVNRILIENGINQDDIAIVRNPPGYYLITGRSAIMVPTGDESTLFAVAQRFQASFLVLEETRLYEKYLHIYQNPDSDPHFIYLGETDGGEKVFRISK